MLLSSVIKDAQGIPIVQQDDMSHDFLTVLISLPTTQMATRLNQAVEAGGTDAGADVDAAVAGVAVKSVKALLDSGCLVGELYATKDCRSAQCSISCCTY